MIYVTDFYEFYNVLVVPNKSKGSNKLLPLYGAIPATIGFSTIYIFNQVVFLPADEFSFWGRTHKSSSFLDYS
jgi:hypothetical protein